MRAVFDNLSRHALLRTFVYLVFGVALLAFPQLVIQVIVYLLAAYVIVLGCINIYNFICCRSWGSLGYDLVSGILMVVLGLLMILFSRQVAGILPLFLGVLLIIGGLSGLIQSIAYGRLAGHASVLLILLNLLVVAGGVLVVLNPFGSAVLLLQIYGGVTIVLAAGEVISFFNYRGLSRGAKGRGA